MFQKWYKGIFAGLVAITGCSSPSGTAEIGQPTLDRDCSDFASQKEAQRFFESAGPGDPHQLDKDGDGTACGDFPYR